MAPEFPSDNPHLWPSFECDDAGDAEIEVVEFADEDFVWGPFERFVSLLGEVALAEGASPEAVAVLPGLVGLARLDVASVPAEAVAALVASGHLERGEDAWLRRSESLVANAVAWRANLEGEETELTATSMLDEWSAALVGALARQPPDRVRRALRARGVAAFGLLDGCSAAA